METKETILAKLNTSPDRLTELVEQDGFYFVRKEITREQYPVIKQFYEYQQQSPSPAIVTIYSVYEKEGHFYINEEWIRGESVEEHLYLQGPFSKDEVIRYAMDLCQGLQWFHKHNMIHRDVTPANVIISEEKKAYLVDPGILREVKKNQTNDTQILGTPGYAAPEQFGFTQSDARTDIYALGVLINQMTTGKMPKEALPKDRRLRKIVTKCTQISAKKRYVNCHQIYKQLDAVLPEYTPASQRCCVENDCGSVPLSFCPARLFITCLIKVDCQDTTDERKFHILILVKYMVLCKEIYVVFFKEIFSCKYSCKCASLFYMV